MNTKKAVTLGILTSIAIGLIAIFGSKAKILTQFKAETTTQTWIINEEPTQPTSNLLTWLQNNATKQETSAEITDLTGYTWIANSTINMPTQNLSILNVKVNFYAGSNLNEISLQNGDDFSFTPTLVGPRKTDSWRLYYDNSHNKWYTNDDGMQYFNISVNEQLRTMLFTGGTDITNTTLISWVRANGILTAPTPTINYETLYNELLEDYETLQNQYDTLENQYELANNAINNLTIANENLEDQLYDLQTEYIDLGDRFLRLQEQYETLLNNYNHLQTQISNGEFEIVPIRSLMLTILSMPFSFISKAFDVKLWPNTPYEFNIGNFIKGIIAILAVLFIIKLFTNGFNAIGTIANTSEERKLNKSKRELNQAKTEKIKKDKKE